MEKYKINGAIGQLYYLFHRKSGFIWSGDCSLGSMIRNVFYPFTQNHRQVACDFLFGKTTKGTSGMFSCFPFQRSNVYWYVAIVWKSNN
ncbi:hypothetical protein J2S74_005215 [Evansella vedderi]|uniref:Uncharacterized protein n=1 Tax=Evansella vedderi TaxID=38282 RepID=A0ABU0A4Z0_9BACI|nr:hypothetical protein [Evansella vedderi]